MSERRKQRTSGVTFTIDSKRIRTNSDGSITVPGELTQAGVAVYEREDGKVRELRPESEVFSEESLDTLRGAAVTIGHPADFLTLDSLSSLQVGVVARVTPEPPKVMGQLRIWDREAAHMVRNGHLSETSGGYGCVPVPTEDTAEADVMQTAIEYNHVALLAEGASRWGTQLRLDSKDNEVIVNTTDTNTSSDVTTFVGSTTGTTINLPFVEAAEEGQDMAELSQVLEAIEGIGSRLDALEEAKATPPEAEEASPIKKFDELPEQEQVQAIIDERVDSMLELELQARDAYHAFFPNDYVEPVRCGHRLCEAVLQTVDSDRLVKDTDDIVPLVQEAQLLAKKERLDSLRSKPTVASIQQQLKGVPASALSTPKSGIRRHIFGNQEG